MLKKGDLIIAVKPMGVLEEGEICTVVTVENENIVFSFGENNVHMGVMSNNEYEKFFKEYKEENSFIEKNTLSEEILKDYICCIDDNKIKAILEKSKISIDTVFEKCTVVYVSLPNNFIIVEHSDFVNKGDYDVEIGFYLCMDKVLNKIYELEAYYNSNYKKNNL